MPKTLVSNSFYWLSSAALILFTAAKKSKNLTVYVFSFTFEEIVHWGYYRIITWVEIFIQKFIFDLKKIIINSFILFIKNIIPLCMS